MLEPLKLGKISPPISKVSRVAFKKRVTENDAKKRAAKAKGETLSTKRLPVQPRKAHIIKETNVLYDQARPYANAA